jgi:hypothetical protein
VRIYRLNGFLTVEPESPEEEAAIELLMSNVQLGPPLEAGFRVTGPLTAGAADQTGDLALTLSDVGAK